MTTVIRGIIVIIIKIATIVIIIFITIIVGPNKNGIIVYYIIV